MVRAVAKGITESVSGAIAIVVAKDNQHCFNCSKFGHFLKDCTEMLSIENNTKDHRWLCANPNQLSWLGNGGQSVDWPHTMTSNGRPPYFARPTGASGEEKGVKTPHGPQIPSPEVPPAMKKVCHMPRYRWEPASNW